MTLPPGPKSRRTRRVSDTADDDRLPEAALRDIVANIPGPKAETQAERAVRFDAELAEAIAYNPRDQVEAFVFVQNIIMRGYADAARREAAMTGTISAHTKLVLESEKLMQSSLKVLKKHYLPHRSPPALIQEAELLHRLIRHDDDPALTEQAVSAIIVPLHPAPKMLQ